MSMKKAVAVSKKRAEKLGGKPKLYLTKRILVSVAKKGVREAAKETMEIMGYNLIVKDGWVVKKYADGSIENVAPI